MGSSSIIDNNNCQSKIHFLIDQQQKSQSYHQQSISALSLSSSSSSSSSSSYQHRLSYAIEQQQQQQQRRQEEEARFCSSALISRDRHHHDNNDDIDYNKNARNLNVSVDNDIITLEMSNSNNNSRSIPFNTMNGTFGTFAVALGDYYFDSFDVALMSNEGCCQMCHSCISKGSLRFGENFYVGGGRTRRYYHDTCVLQRINLQDIPPVQRTCLEQHRLKLVKHYSQGRLLLAERRHLFEMLQRLNLQLSKSPQTSLDILEDITINVPKSADQIVKCLCMTPSLVQLYGTQILNTIQQYKQQQQQQQQHINNNAVPTTIKRRILEDDVFSSSPSPVTTVTATTTVMMEDDHNNNEWLPPPPLPLTSFHSQPTSAAFYLQPRGTVPQCGAAAASSNKRMKRTVTEEQQQPIEMMTD